MFELWIIIAGCAVIAVYCNWPEKKQYVKRDKKQSTQDIIAGWKKW